MKITIPPSRWIIIVLLGYPPSTMSGQIREMVLYYYFVSLSLHQWRINTELKCHILFNQHHYVCYIAKYNTQEYVRFINVNVVVFVMHLCLLVLGTLLWYI